ncbi:MAG: N-acetyl-gamma-glutamyl-phosphate reductase [Candidatus Dadabacteria bacterium]|nr:MAG: N-acetyl-gamma-glutamyl-phosphate reductase [Candidatus Dadabacteria bacterium]
MNKITASIIGGSGYVGGELLRILLRHPAVRIEQVTSERFAKKPISFLHPHLRKKTDLKFSSLTDLKECDLIFSCLPHGELAKKYSNVRQKCQKLIDLSADFRLRDPEDYKKYYSISHPLPEKLTSFVYGIAELHREEIRRADEVACAGCNATVSILGLYPLFSSGIARDASLVIEVKVGSSEAGRKITPYSHHPERAHTVRAFKPVGHRHTAEIVQELRIDNPSLCHLSVTSVDLVRGASALAHILLSKEVTEKELWQIYRESYAGEPFIRIVKDASGRLPEPKGVVGSNYCDIGFAKDPFSNRVVIISVIDNLIKGAAGQAIQAMNLMYGIKETEGLEDIALYPL